MFFKENQESCSLAGKQFLKIIPKKKVSQYLSEVKFIQHTLIITHSMPGTVLGARNIKMSHLDMLLDTYCLGYNNEDKYLLNNCTCNVKLKL